MKAIDEWNNLVSKMDKIYIYGAGKVAEKIRDLLGYSGKLTCLKGYIVSSKSSNPDEIDGLPVLLLSDSLDKKAVVLISLSEIYHPDVFGALKSAGFASIVPVHKYFSIEIEKPVDMHKSKSKHIDENVILSRDLSDYRGRMIDKYFSYSHAFGQDGFYQSFPMLGIRGTRSTDVRMDNYNLKDYITPESTVLDIGSNIGFLDIEISRNVKTILGLEYSDILVKIANETAKTVGADNVSFISCDYNEWQKHNGHCFDVIFSFAVHAWLNIAPDVYARQIVDMLNANGIVIFESQQLSTDKMFDTFVEALVGEKLKVLKEGIVNDDGETDRKFIVLKKCYEDK